MRSRRHSVGEILQWILLAIAAVFGLAFGVQKAKATKATKAKEKAEEERDKLKIVNTLQKDADEIKNDLVKKKAENASKKEEVIQSIADIPDDKEVELSDEEKQIAADQYDRARARAERLQNDLGSAKR